MKERSIWPVFATCLAAGLVLCVVMFALVAPHYAAFPLLSNPVLQTEPGSPCMSRAAYDQLREGMSRAQCVRIIGFEPRGASSAGVTFVAGGGYWLVYSGLNGDFPMVSLLFENDRLKMKSQVGL